MNKKKDSRTGKVTGKSWRWTGARQDEFVVQGLNLGFYFKKREVLEGRMGEPDELEEEIATHFSILARKIPRTEGPGRLRSMGSQRVGHELATKQQEWENIMVCSGLQFSFWVEKEEEK